jgi:hypothetical protein
MFYSKRRRKEVIRVVCQEHATSFYPKYRNLTQPKFIDNGLDERILNSLDIRLRLKEFSRRRLCGSGTEGCI